MGSRQLNLIGNTFGRLTVISQGNGYVSPGGNKSRTWICQCECGNQTEVTTGNLSYGKTNSCGCLANEQTARRNKLNKLKHGQTVKGKSLKTYDCYHAMLQRCYNSNTDSYLNYGGRGIIVCDRWRYGENNKSGFECFLEDMGEAPKGMSIEREEVEDNYCPQNCMWATSKTQGNNKRNNRFITYQGRTQTLMQWSEELRINYRTLQYRLDKGWSVEKAFGKPVRKKVAA